MLTATPLAEDVLMIDITGKLKPEHIETAIIALEEMSAEHDAFSLLIDLSGYAGMTPAAFMADVGYGLGHFSELNRYQRVAVVTPHGWVARLVAIENMLFPKIDLRSFTPEQRQAAEHFALGKIVDTSPAKPHVTRLGSNREDLVAFRLTGTLDRYDATAIVAILQHSFATHGRVDLLVEMDGSFGFDPTMLLSADLWKTKRDAMAHVDRYAIIAAPKFVASVAENLGGLTPVTIKTFEADQVDEAWTWLGAVRL